MVEYLSWSLDTVDTLRENLTVWWIWLPMGSVVWYCVLKAYMIGESLEGGARVKATIIGSLAGLWMAFLSPFVIMLLPIFLPIIAVCVLVIGLGFMVTRGTK